MLFHQQNSETKSLLRTTSAKHIAGEITPAMAQILINSGLSRNKYKGFDFQLNIPIYFLCQFF